jgi:hypothetical protein
MPRYTWRLVLALVRKILKARAAGKSSISPTVMLCDYEGGLSPRVAGKGHKEIVYTLERHELEKAMEIANFVSINLVKAELPPLPSPVGGATSAPSGGNDEGFGVKEGEIVTAGTVPSTGCQDVGEAVEISPISEKE